MRLFLAESWRIMQNSAAKIVHGRPMKRETRQAVFAVLFFLLLLAPAQRGAFGGEVMKNSGDAVPNIDAPSLERLSKNEEPIVYLDVRSPEEYRQGHIEGALLMPLDSLPTRYKELPRDKKIVVYCRSGRRSAQAISFLRSQGYENVLNLSGGYVAWAASHKDKTEKGGFCSLLGIC